ncbi:MAG: Yip1 family protein [Bacteroidales bacterium]
MSNGGFDFKQFISDSVETLTKPKKYFEEMSLTGGLVEPLIKAVLYGAIAGIIYFLWGVLNLSAMGGLFGGAIGIMAFIWMVVGSIIGLFISAVIILVISAIAKGNTDFEACVRVAASIMVLLPVIAILSLFSGVSLKLYGVIRIIVNLYGLWLLYNALIGSLKANQKTSQIIMLVFVVIFVLVFLAGLGAKRTADRYMRNMDRESREMLRDFGLD